jgi:hypothetical protein
MTMVDSVQDNRRPKGNYVPPGTAAIAAVAALAFAALPTAAQGSRPPTAHASRTLNVNDASHLHLVRSSGSLLYEEGSNRGALAGKMNARLDIGPTFTGSFTIHTSAGEVMGHGSASPHGSGRYESFSGTVVVTGGTGRYAHAHGTAGLYGTFDRDTYAFVIQTKGKLSY